MTYEEQKNLLLNSDFLDADWYIDTYPDVASAEMTAADHYLKYGALMGRDPGPAFNTRFYLRQNPDVAQSKINPLVHFLVAGQQEDRAPAP